MSLFSHPIKKLTLAAAFGIGYTLGAKAGRERYEQIKNTAQQVKNDSRVQQATAQAEEFVRETASKVTDDPRVHDVVERAESLLGDVKDAADDGTLVDKAKDVASDVKDKAEDVKDEAKHKADDVKDAVTDAKPHDPRAGGDPKISPLLVDEHVESEERVAYSTGPDIEETIDELAPDDRNGRI